MDSGLLGLLGLLGGDEAVADGVTDQRGDIVNAEFIHHAGSMGFDRLDAEVELSTDFLAAEPLGDEL